MPNRLASESSPYLLQHANNPVDWYPWGEDAFERARREDKPIFLSVGYSTCHWCHVMEHESFEQEAVAGVLNEAFVSIKVDREERPDVDRVYMTFVQATTGQGGWPMSVWLTPDLRPFFGGTYFPPESRWGRPGFIDVLREVARLWRDERGRVLASATAVTDRLRAGVEEDANAGAAGVVAGRDAVVEGARQFVNAYDEEWGGFGTSPKFPRPSELLFLLRAFATTGDVGLREVVTGTLRGMALGGMRDHVGGGFHRYSVDRQWRVPHFEKMLYDQAQLVIALVETAQATGEPFWTWVALDTLDYVSRDMTHPDGGFYSAEDADSIPPEHAADPAARKTEGAFYLWRDDELEALLGPRAAAVKAYFGVQAGGNAPHDPQGEFTGKNLLYIAATPDEIAEATGSTADEVTRHIDEARRLMFAARSTRPRPHLDDKVLTSWNGLMIAAYARTARALGGSDAADASTRAGLLRSAERAATFVRARLWQEDTATLLRRFRDGQAAIPAYAEDYACLVWGLLELFQASGDAAWLEWAVALQRRQDELFWDEAHAGWFSTTGHDPSVLLRLKEDYDGAEPSATSVSVMNLLVLAHLMEDARWPRMIERTLARFGERMAASARAVPHMMAALTAWHAGVGQVVIAGPRDRDDTVALERVVESAHRPFIVTVPVDVRENAERLARVMPWIAAMGEADGRSAAYVCRNFACERPVTGPGELAALLDR